MKLKLLLLSFLLSITCVFSQSINYKALIKDGSGNVVANDLIVVQFTILKTTSTGTMVYKELHTPNTDANGLVIVNIGEGTPLSGIYADIDWGADIHFLKTEINTEGSLVHIGTTQFMAVPYAKHAETAANAASKIDDLSDGKSDADGSSLFLGVDAGGNDDGTNNNNIGIGFNALYSNTTGFYNTATGYEALYSNTTGSQNTAIGRQALRHNTEGSLNTANGIALQRNTTGSQNTAIGYGALFYNSMGGSNTAIGRSALSSNTEGYVNTAIGYYALVSNETGEANTAIGHRAGYNSLGNSNIFIGSESGYFETESNRLYIENTNADSDNALIYGEFDTNILRTNSEFQIGNPTVTGYAFPTSDGTANQVLQTDGNGSLSWNVSVQSINNLADGKTYANGNSLFLGTGAGINDDGTANNNVGIGFQALNSNTEGVNNTANGFRALYSNTEGGNNTATGSQALDDNTEGYENTATGMGALGYNESGNNNTANGMQALLNNITGSNNTANGAFALYSNQGNNNTANGMQALNKNTSGIENTATGFGALYTNDTGSWNTANGSEALYKNTQGSFNTAIGRQALYNNDSGSNNTAIGYEALHRLILGGNNTAIGRMALFYNTTGSNNVAIGYDAQVPSPIASNQVRLGNTSIGYAGIQVAWTVTSDKRWKDNIRELPYGLEFVKQLKPVDYVRKNNEHKTREMGFIAQDVEALLTKIGYTDQGFLSKDDDGFLSVRYNDFIALLTKAIQEQQELIVSQKKEIETLTAEQKSTNNRLNKIETLLNTSQQ